MTNKWFRIVALASVLTVPWAAAENAFVLVFLEDAPLRHVKVAVDGKIVGVTNGDGLVQATLEPGPHKLYLIDDDLAIPVKFDLAIDGEIEISAVFSQESGVEPIVKSQSFTRESKGSGYITGVVTSPSGLPIAGASVQVVDIDIAVETDAEGVYSLELPRGLHRINISRSGYRSSSIDAIRVFADFGINARFKLLKRPPVESQISMPTPRLEEVVTLGIFNPTSGAENIERYATSIVSAMDADQIARFGDSDVAVALGRMAGLSVTEGKYANVRGLDGRYIATNFNGILMPSTDPMRRDIQLDLFPSNIVESISVQKSFSADQLASTTGGSISVITKGMPDERIGKMSISTGFNTGSTFDEVQRYRDSKTEWMGFDGGLRDVHSAVLAGTDGGTSLTVCDPTFADICTSRELALAYALTFKPDYDIKTTKADPDIGVNIDFGDRLTLSEGELGYFVAASYGRSTAYRGEAALNNPLDLNGMYRRTQDTVSFSTYGVVGYEFDRGEIVSKTTLLRSTDDTTRNTIAVNAEDININKAILEYVQRQLFAQSIEGNYAFDTRSFESKLDWQIGYAETDRLEPDRRQYYLQGDSLATSSLERRWSDLNEVSNDIGFDYTATFDWGDSNTTSVVIGGLLSDKDRTVDLYRFGIRLGDHPVPLTVTNGLDSLLSIQNFAADAFRLRPATAATDSYDSSERLDGYYIKFANDFGDNWSAELGARYESFTQKIMYPNESATDNGLLKQDAWYPAVNLSWRATEELQLRLGYSQTVSYPGLIERSSSQSYDPVTDDPIFGNSGLTVSEINNLDLRLEYYFGETNSMSLAFFSKEVSNPVERAVPDASGSAADGVTFRNQEKADLEGIEFDFNTIVFDQNEHTVFVNGNVSYIDSSVTLGAKSLQLEGIVSDGRQLQGQSEYLANLQIGYDHFPSGQKVTFLVNYFDDRIFRTARGAALGPIVEIGRAVIDLNYEKEFGEQWGIKLQLKNLTDEPISYSQNNNLIESYELGTSISLSLSYRL